VSVRERRFSKQLRQEWERACEEIADAEIHSYEWGYMEGLREAMHIADLCQLPRVSEGGERLGKETR
jgi:hypothetical protein